MTQEQIDTVSRIRELHREVYRYARLSAEKWEELHELRQKANANNWVYF